MSLELSCLDTVVVFFIGCSGKGEEEKRGGGDAAEHSKRLRIRGGGTGEWECGGKTGTQNTERRIRSKD